MHIFSIMHRVGSIDSYLKNLECVAALSEKYGLTGVLLFSDNDTYFDPWVAAAELLTKTKRISPLVAVNPIYMHPFTAAKMISSLTQLYRRRIYLNMITGTALSHLDAIGDRLSHDDRYLRLSEYIDILRRLLKDKRPLRYSGLYYDINDLMLPLGVPGKYMPEFFLAGRSDAALSVCMNTGSTAIRMLSSKLDSGILKTPGIHFGIVTRQTEQQAWAGARSLFPSCPEDLEIVLHSMQNTDSSWKNLMIQELEQVSSEDRNGFWLEPFANASADCPFLVGSYDYIAEKLNGFIERGVSTFILDIPASEDEFFHVWSALRMSKLSSAIGL